jgi:hypothetical protein
MDQGERARGFSAYVDSLPPQQQGGLILVLWANAVLTLGLAAAQLALVARMLRRAARGDPTATVLDVAVSPSGATLLSASALHKLVRERFARRLDQRIRAETAAD